MSAELTRWVALGAGGAGFLALVACLALWLTLRRVRSAQKTLLPDGITGDLASRQHDLQQTVTRLETSLRDLEALVSHQAEATEGELRKALHFQGLIRYDAYRDMGGQQSWSIAFIDGMDTGAVLTCLHARDHARVYLKELVSGVSEQRLSPEEEQAVESATGRPRRRSAA